VPAGEHREAGEGEDGAECCGDPGDEGDHGADPDGEEQPDDREGRGEAHGEGETGAQPGGEASHWAYGGTGVVGAADCAGGGGQYGG